MEDDPIDSNIAAQVKKVRTTLTRYRGLILAAVGVLLAVSLALLYRQQQQAKEYEEAFRKGMKLWGQREAERGLGELRKASKLDPRDPELWLTIGRCELALNHADRALDAWEEALKREAGYKPALFERGKEMLGRHIARRIPPPVDPATGWLSQRLEPVDRVEGGVAELQRVLADVNDVEFVAEFTRFAKGARDLLEGRYRNAVASLRAYADQNAWDAGALALVGVAGRYGAVPRAAERAFSDALPLRNEKLWLRLRAESRYLSADYAGAKTDFAEAGAEKEAEPLFARRIPAQGLILWLRADAGVELSGASVSKWADQSTGKHDAVPRDPAAGPKLTAAAVHKRPALLFAGKDDELRLPDGFEEFGAGLSVFVVGEPPAPPSDPWSFISLATPSRGALPIEVLLGHRRETPALVYSVEDLKSLPVPYIKGVELLKEFIGIGAVQEPSGSVRLYKRGTLLETGTLTLPSKLLRNQNRLGLGLKGHLAEVLLYNRNLSDLERIGVEAYLEDRYFSDGAAAAPPTEKR